MADHMLLVVVSLSILLTIIPSISACKCDVSGRETPEFLCKFDYVLHGDVEKEQLTGNNASVMDQMRIYTVKVREIFRGLEKIKNVSKNHNISYVEIYTSQYGPACGITLRLKGSYVIAGAIRNTLKAYSCGWQKDWGSIKYSFKEYFPELRYCSGTQLHAVKFLFLVTLLLTVYFT